MKKVVELISELRRQDVKLWLDGDRLRYRAGKDSLNPELIAQLKDQKVEIINFLRSMKVQTGSQIPPLVSADRQQNLPLSFGQQRLWFVHQFEPSSSANNVPVTVRLTGNLSISALVESLHEIVMRHEVLRTSFPLVDGNPVQSIAPDFPKSLPIVDLSALSPAERQDEARRISAIESRKPFDLEHGPIVRFMLIKFDDRDCLLIRNMHCIICDGASCDLFYEELIALYTAFSIGQPSPLAPLPIQYADFSVWQRQWLQGEILETQVKYWQQKLSGSLSTIQLPYDRPRPQGAEAYLGNSRGLMLPKSLNQALTQLSQQCGATLFMLLLTAFEVFLHRYSGQEDLLISFASAARGQVETERLLGFFSNTLFLRTKLERHLTFRELLDRVRQDCVDAYNHQDIPFEKLVEEIRPEQNQDRSPLFQTKFTLNLPWSEGRGVTKVELPDLQIAPQTGYVYPGQTKYDLILVVREQDEGLRTVFDYNADLFDVATIDRMLGHMQNLLEGIVANPDCPISELPLLTKPEQQQLLEWNQTQVEYPAKCIHQLFEEQVQRTPDAVAVVFEDRQLTYQELNARSNQLANYLGTVGVGADVPVGICIERSLAMAIGLLGILKAGGAYVPLDPAYPQARLAYMLENSQIAVLLVSQQSVNELPSHHVPIVNLDSDWVEEIAQQSSENLDLAVEPDRLSYVIYTSGSTGIPKGVAMTQRAISNLISWQLQQPRSQDRPKTLQFAPISFDVSCQEIFATWCAGGTLVLIDEQLRLDPLALLQLIDRHEIERLFLPVVALQQLAQVAVSHELFPAGLRDIIASGEQLKITPAIQKFFTKLDNCRLHNHYGPTESHVVSALTLSDPVENWPAIPSIGRPIANTQIYVLSPDLQPVPIGTSGELYIGGDCLARGYFNRPDLTAERFIPNPFRDRLGDTSRLYKTGDVARYWQDGNIEYLGRIDDQVKIRGFRIELGEIETLLVQHPAISQATVAVREDLPGDRQLVAYCVVDLDRPPTNIELRDFIAQKVPNYMVPLIFVMLSTLPISPNGKIDRRALPVPDYSRPESENTFVAPRNELERQLTQIWQKILGIDSIGIQDNFFELGGHSLIAVQMFAEIERTWGKNLPLATLFQAQSIEKLADVMSQQGWVAPWSSLVPLQTNGSKSPLFLIHSIGGNILEYYLLSHYLGQNRPVYALQSQGLDGKQEPLTSVEDMASHYLQEIQTVQPQGPYFLAGYSFGGLIAYEIAQQLCVQGQNVAFLAQLDTKRPNHYTKTRPSLPKVIQLHLQNLQQLKIKEKIQYIQDRVEHLISNNSYKEYIIRELSKTTPLTPQYLNLLDCNLHANQSYRPIVYPGKMILFRCQIQNIKSAMSPDLGWDGLPSGGLEIKHVPGNHYGMLKEPLVQVVAEKIQFCLQKAQANSSSSGGCK
jgi:amino acid adenylation domain-containing protein